MCLTYDSQYLVSGDSQGLIYVWNISSDYNQVPSNLTSPRSGALPQKPTHDHSILTTFELHKDKGAITNLLCIYRPLSMYGLTANMKAYEPFEVKQF